MIYDEYKTLSTILSETNMLPATYSLPTKLNHKDK